MVIYNNIVQGISEFKSNSLSIEEYLSSLKKDVRMLRSAYRKYPVYVPYQQKDIQSAYLLTYLPHYYQLIEKVLREQNPDHLAQKKEVCISFIGGGPGSEVYGTIKHIIEHNRNIKKITVNILDINASNWIYSHKIVGNNLIKELSNDIINKVLWNALDMDLTNLESVKSNAHYFKASDLIVIQNCINEIATNKYNELSKSIHTVFNYLPQNAALLMIDLTSSIRSQISSLEKELKQNSDVKQILGTMSLSHPSKMISINARPSELVKKNLLDGSDGLIPRKNLSYDYSYISKSIIQENRLTQAKGIQTLYDPLRDLSINEAKQRTFIGFDFGTSVSVCTLAYVKNNKLCLKSIPITQKGKNKRVSTSPLVPTIIGIDNRQYMIGKHAFDAKASLEIGINTWYGFKENLGNLENILYPNSILANHPKVKIANAKQALIAYLTYIKDEVSRHVIKNNLPQDIYYNVSIPASYPGFKKEELKDCLEKAGISYKNNAFTFEPIAALTYAIYEQEVILNKENQKVLIFDIGAGTLDVSILSILKQGVEVDASILALERIDEIGGQKLDELIAEEINIKCEFENSPDNRHYIEKLKIVMCKSISMDSNHQLPDEAFGETNRTIKMNNDQTLSMSFKKLNSATNKYWTLVEGTINTALKKGDINVSQVDDVILSGGGAKNPYIRALVRNYFSLANMVFPDDIQEQVSRGTALHCFVQNSFGQNLINTCIASDIWVESKTGNRLIFREGTEAPSLDKEFNVGDLINNKLTLVNKQHKEKLIFEIPSNFNAGFLYLDSDQEVICEVIINEKVSIIKPTYKKS